MSNGVSVDHIVNKYDMLASAVQTFWDKSQVDDIVTKLLQDPDINTCCIIKQLQHRGMHVLVVTPDIDGVNQIEWP